MTPAARATAESTAWKPVSMPETTSCCSIAVSASAAATSSYRSAAAGETILLQPRARVHRPWLAQAVLGVGDTAIFELQVERAELVPFGQDNQKIGVLRSLVGIVQPVHAGQQRLAENGQLGALPRSLLEPRGDFLQRRLPLEPGGGDLGQRDPKVDHLLPSP